MVWRSSLVQTSAQTGNTWGFPSDAPPRARARPYQPHLHEPEETSGASVKATAARWAPPGLDPSCLPTRNFLRLFL